jgi:hypothetical protein
LTATVETVELANPPLCDLEPCFIALCNHGEFDSISDLTGHKQWKARRGVLESAFSDDTAEFNTSVLPLDGRTLRPRHFDHLWDFFGFPENPFPPRREIHRTALVELAETRNDVAHGEKSPTRVGRVRRVERVRRRVEQVESIGEHLALSVEKYVSNKDYLK